MLASHVPARRIPAWERLDRLRTRGSSLSEWCLVVFGWFLAAVDGRGLVSAGGPRLLPRPLPHFGQFPWPGFRKPSSSDRWPRLRCMVPLMAPAPQSPRCLHAPDLRRITPSGVVLRMIPRDWRLPRILLPRIGPHSSCGACPAPSWRIQAPVILERAPARLAFHAATCTLQAEERTLHRIFASYHVSRHVPIYFILISPPLRSPTHYSQSPTPPRVAITPLRDPWPIQGQPTRLCHWQLPFGRILTRWHLARMR